MIQQQRLRPDEFIALRSLLRSEWRRDDGLFWKEQGRWVCVYRNSESWHQAFEIVERLVSIGFVQEAARTCCPNHWGEPLWRLTPRGMEFIRKANLTKQPRKQRLGRPSRGLLSHWGHRLYWLARRALQPTHHRRSQ